MMHSVKRGGKRIAPTAEILGLSLMNHPSIKVCDRVGDCSIRVNQFFTVLFLHCFSDVSK